MKLARPKLCQLFKNFPLCLSFILSNIHSCYAIIVVCSFVIVVVSFHSIQNGEHEIAVIALCWCSLFSLGFEFIDWRAYVLIFVYFSVIFQFSFIWRYSDVAGVCASCRYIHCICITKVFNFDKVTKFVFDFECVCVFDIKRVFFSFSTEHFEIQRTKYHRVVSMDGQMCYCYCCCCVQTHRPR